MNVIDKRLRYAQNGDVICEMTFNYYWRQLHNTPGENKKTKEKHTYEL